MDRASRIVDAVVDGGRVPDPVMRAAIRFLLRRRLARERRGGSAAVEARRGAVLDRWSSGPVAVETDAANDQHYEVPTELYELMLGPHLKYSSCLWDGDPGDADPDGLGDAEAAMLALTCQRAALRDGQRVLELGCGWGSLTLWMADRLPASEIVAVSNSSTQRRHIQDQAAARGLGNVTVVTADVNDFGVDASTADLVAPGFDRVVSVEMFEHVRNHVVLLDRIARWLRPDGLAFVHVFCHRDLTYPFDPGEAAAGDGVRSGTDWMTRHFFAGGVMPSFDHFVRLDTDMQVRRSWQVDGRHYAATCRAWRARLDADPERAVAVLGGGPTGRARLHRWRVFTMACEELFAMRGGHEWFVAHHVMAPRDGGGHAPAG